MLEVGAHRRAPCPRGAGSARDRCDRGTSTSPSRRRRTSRPRCARRAPCPRRRASRSGGSRPARTSRSPRRSRAGAAPTRGGSQSRVPRGCSIRVPHRSCREERVRRALARRSSSPARGRGRRASRAAASRRACAACGRARPGSEPSRSVRPTLPANSTSPLSSTSSIEVGDVRRRVPGNRQHTHRERSDLELSRRLPGPRPEGLERRSASPAGMYTRTPVAAATDATPPTWSTCPCVTRIALGSRPRAAISPRIRSGSAPGSTTSIAASESRETR